MELNPIKRSKHFVNFEKNPQLRNLDTKRVILFTNARDEKHIKEWVGHHLSIGFSLVYIFDHKSKIPLKTVLNNFSKKVIVERCEMDGVIKIPLMNKAVKIANFFMADWFIYMDADEFLHISGYKGVKHLLNTYKFSDALGINWLMYGSNGHIKEPEGNIRDNYTKSELMLNQHVKTFVRPTQVISVQDPHSYKIVNPNRMTTINGVCNLNHPQFNNWSCEFKNCPVFIAHYINQSEETYINRKVKLPTDDTNTFRNKNLNIHSQFNDVDNFTLLTKPHSSTTPTLTTDLNDTSLITTDLNDTSLTTS